MKFKTLFLSASLIAIASVFSFCTKDAPVTEPVTEAADSNDEANSRGVCKVLVESINANIDVCGSQTNINPCSGLLGTDFIAVNGNRLYVVNTPASMIFTAVNPVAASGAVRITTSNGTTVHNFAANGGVVNINIDNNCNH